MITYRHQNRGQNHNLWIVSKTFENVEMLRY